MNDIRKIIISNGWEPDQNNALEEVVIPSTIETLNAPRKVTFLGKKLTWIPTTVAALQEFAAPNMESITGNLFSGYALTNIDFPSLKSITAQSSSLFNNCTNLTSVRFESLESIACSGNSVGTFKNCSSLSSLYMPNLKTITTGDGGLDGIFQGCNSLTSINFPSLESIVNGNMKVPFYGCVNITNITLPKLKTTQSTNNNWGTFIGLTGLQTVILGSEDNPVQSLWSTTFKDCTQSGLTITIYTSGGAALSGSPWGATNATIVYEEA